MRRLLNWRSGVAAGALAALAACGGGEVIAVLGFIGSAGGDWLQDDKPGEAAGEVGLQLRSTCGVGGNQDCFINIQPASGADNLFATAFDVSFTSNLPGCAPSGNGRANGSRLTLTGCFSGRYVTINQAVSDDGATRMFFDFTPDLTQGVWVEIQSAQRRFAFKSNNAGCELSSSATRAVTVALNDSDVTIPGGPYETTIASFAIAGDGAAWQGRFVGVSGMRLTRGNEVLELERRQGSDTCPP